MCACVEGGRGKRVVGWMLRAKKRPEQQGEIEKIWKSDIKK